MINIGQFIGIIAIVLSFFIYIQKGRFQMLLLKLFTDILWVAHHLCIFSYTAAATTGISVLREVVFFRIGNSIYRKIVSALFIVCYAVAAAFTWKDGFSILPAVASVEATLAFGNEKVEHIRFFAFLASVCMLIYGVHYFSVPTMINEVLTQGSILISVVKKQKTGDSFKTK